VERRQRGARVRLKGGYEAFLDQTTGAFRLDLRPERGGR
jgi:hypothetical protein